MFLILFLIFLPNVYGQNIFFQSLNGQDWSAKNSSQLFSISATVPGSIYSDLKKFHIIDDIYHDFNDINYRSFSQQNWTFEKFFNVDAKLFKKNQIYLVAHGLDTVGDIYLNDKHLGSVNNQFIRYRWPVKNILTLDQPNHIVVSFQSAQKYAFEKFLKYPYIVPPNGIPPAQNGEMHVNFIRKMQSSFSWDWGPAFPTQGIWKPIELEAYNDFKFRDITVQTMLGHDNRWNLNYKTIFECIPNHIIQGVMNFRVGKINFSSTNFYQHCDSNSETMVKGSLIMPYDEIQAWYPNNMGQQNLYNFDITVTSISGEQQKKSIRIGFRTIEIIQKRLPSELEAYSFVFSINGKQIFAKGSNWIPAHALQEAISDAYLQDLVISAKLANMNMLRVWGGGVYESDRFYQLADELGILIWHDLMFACALYPVDKPFLNSVSVEVQQQIRRLQHHPSIALWAGNNENEVAIATSWWPEVDFNLKRYQDDYRLLYIDTIKPIVLKEDPQRPYLSSSPSNGIVGERENYTASNPMDNRFGDVHHYVVNGNVWDWKMHPSAKFVSEYGFQSWSSHETLSKSISSQYLKYPLSSQLLQREHQQSGMEYLTNMIATNFKLPGHNDNNALDKFIYLSQIHQAMAIKLQTEFYRRNRQVNSDGTGNTMGALYWQLNDIWPTVSWASIEFGGKWKMLHYYAQKMFDNVLIDVYLDDDLLKVALTRDDYEPAMHFDVTISLHDWHHSNTLWKVIIPAISLPFSSMTVYQNNLSKIMSVTPCISRKNCLVHVTATNPKTAKSWDNFLLLESPKNSNISNSVTITRIFSGPIIENGLAKFKIDFQAHNGISPFVWLEMAPEYKIYGLFSENGFLLINQRTVWFQTLANNITQSTVVNAMRIKTLMDYYK